MERTDPTPGPDPGTGTGTGAPSFFRDARTVLEMIKFGVIAVSNL